MEHYVGDTELTIPDRKPVDRTVPRAHPPHTMTRELIPMSGKNGKVTVYKVSKEEMEKLWE